MLTLRVFFCLLFFLAAPGIWLNVKGPESHSFSCRLAANDQPCLPPEALTAMAQPFSYWGQGSQFYVFLSQNQRYVLKIPRAAKMGEGVIGRLLCGRSRKPPVLNSMAIAAGAFLRETALLYAHYGKSPPIPPIVLIDNLHRRERVDLNNIPFVLQEKKLLLSQALVEASDRQKILLAYLDLIGLEGKKGYMSSDSAFWLNFGYDSGKACRIDVGSYVPLDSRFSLEKVAKPVLHWLKIHDPSLHQWFEMEITKRAGENK